MKKIKVLALLLLASIFCVYAQKPVLKFNDNGKFKIIQITDTHFILDDPRSDVVPQLLKEVIEAEQPDLMIFTGDMIWQNKDAKKAIDALFASVIEKQIPWAYVFGNHDDEEDMSRLQLMDYVVQKPYCLAVHGDKYLAGVGNYALEVRNNADTKVASVLYCMDSHAYSKVEGVGGYGWFDHNQVDWYKKQSEAYRIANDGKDVPSLGFFHIPLSEYVEMASKPENLIGTKKEDECNGKLNTGMFAAMRMAGDMMGTFVGHDHDNDYIGKWYDIYLAYGRYSGGNTVYNNLGNNGCRIIEMTEGVKEFTTYIRLLGGEKLYEVHYPNTFRVEEKK